MGEEFAPRGGPGETPLERFGLMSCDLFSMLKFAAAPKPDSARQWSQCLRQLHMEESYATHRRSVFFDA